MHKPLRFSLILKGLIIISKSLGAQPSILWMEYYGGDQDDVAACIRQTRDMGFIIVGYSKSCSSGKSDVWLMKIKADGEQEWHRTFSGDEIDCGVSICQTSDGDYFL